MNAVLDALQQRVSNPIRTLTKKTPSPEQWHEIFKAVASAPDYGSLLPYKFYVIQGEKLHTQLQLLRKSRLKNYPDFAENIAKKMDIMQKNLGAFVLVTHTHNNQAKQSEHDQLCATICASSHFYLALNALDFGAVWITPAKQDRQANAEKYNFAKGEFITGVFMIGGIGSKPEKQRPHPEKFVKFV